MPWLSHEVYLCFNKHLRMQPLPGVHLQSIPMLITWTKMFKSQTPKAVLGWRHGLSERSELPKGVALRVALVGSPSPSLTPHTLLDQIVVGQTGPPRADRLERLDDLRYLFS